MRHYEIVFIVHPDQSEQVPAMVDKYKKTITESGGSIHRQEDWGRRMLAHPIEKIHKAHYILLNVECDKAPLDEIVSSFKFNDAVLRYLIVKRDHAITHQSFLGKEREDELRREKEDALPSQAKKLENSKDSVVKNSTESNQEPEKEKPSDSNDAHEQASEVLSTPESEE
jgi:small subunit ribosomal protein S6